MLEKRIALGLDHAAYPAGIIGAGVGLPVAEYVLAQILVNQVVQRRIARHGLRYIYHVLKIGARCLGFVVTNGIDDGEASELDGGRYRAQHHRISGQIGAHLAVEGQGVGEQEARRVAEVIDVSIGSGFEVERLQVRTYFAGGAAVHLSDHLVIVVAGNLKAVECTVTFKVGDRVIRP